VTWSNANVSAKRTACLSESAWVHLSRQHQTLAPVRDYFKTMRLDGTIHDAEVRAAFQHCTNNIGGQALPHIDIHVPVGGEISAQHGGEEFRHRTGNRDNRGNVYC
jgi:hypothetical protein